jgi:hypothetical protein
LQTQLTIAIFIYHDFSYITASKSGLSENELEDILCLDEEVLQDVFRFQIPQGKKQVGSSLTDN